MCLSFCRLMHTVYCFFDVVAITRQTRTRNLFTYLFIYFLFFLFYLVCVCVCVCVWGRGGGAFKNCEFSVSRRETDSCNSKPLNKKIFLFYFVIFRGGGGRVPTGQVVTAHSLAQIHFHFPDKCHLFINY